MKNQNNGDEKFRVLVVDDLAGDELSLDEYLAKWNCTKGEIIDIGKKMGVEIDMERTYLGAKDRTNHNDYDLAIVDLNFPYSGKAHAYIPDTSSFSGSHLDSHHIKTIDEIKELAEDAEKLDNLLDDVYEGLPGYLKKWNPDKEAFINQEKKVIQESSDYRNEFSEENRKLLDESDHFAGGFGKPAGNCALVYNLLKNKDTNLVFYTGDKTHSSRNIELLDKLGIHNKVYYHSKIAGWKKSENFLIGIIHILKNELYDN